MLTSNGHGFLPWTSNEVIIIEPAGIPVLAYYCHPSFPCPPERHIMHTTTKHFSHAWKRKKKKKPSLPKACLPRFKQDSTFCACFQHQKLRGIFCEFEERTFQESGYITHPRPPLSLSLYLPMHPLADKPAGWRDVECGATLIPPPLPPSPSFLLSLSLLRLMASFFSFQPNQMCLSLSSSHTPLSLFANSQLYPSPGLDMLKSKCAPKNQVHFFFLAEIALIKW